MLLLHTSDWHLGRSLETVSMAEHQRGFLTWLTALVADQHVDAVLVCGDVFDRAIPSVEAIGLLDDALRTLIRHCPVILIPGNHDSAHRLAYGGALFEVAGVHLRAHLDDLTRPVELTDDEGTRVLVYGIPYLQPEAVRAALDTDRTHAAVLTAAMDRIRADLAERRSADSAEPAPRAVVMAHAFITGGQASDSERDVSVGGVADAPVDVFAGVDYVALGHLHGPQSVGTEGGTHARYSGTPLAYSFSEAGHEKSVTLVDIGAGGEITVRPVPVPVPRRLSRITGDLATLLADDSFAPATDDWVWAELTDARRPENAMDQVRTRFPHAIKLTWEPHVDGVPASFTDRRVDPSSVTPLTVVTSFIEHVTASPATDEEIALARDSVERVAAAEAFE